MMEKTWRWFGKKDKITLQMLRQIGVEGIVTALHEVPNGEIWTVEAINDLKSYIESYGLRCLFIHVWPRSKECSQARDSLSVRSRKHIFRILARTRESQNP